MNDPRYPLKTHNAEERHSCLARRVHALADNIPPRLLRDHDRKSLKVVQRSPLLDRSTLLRPARVLPFLEDLLLLKLLLNST